MFGQTRVRICSLHVSAPTMTSEKERNPTPARPAVAVQFEIVIVQLNRICQSGHREIFYDSKSARCGTYHQRQTFSPRRIQIPQGARLTLIESIRWQYCSEF